MDLSGRCPWKYSRSLVTLSHFFCHCPRLNVEITYVAIMTNEWSLDFCLVCDWQTLDSPYCSQTCRLTEMDLLSGIGRTTISTTMYRKEWPTPPHSGLSAVSMPRHTTQNQPRSYSWTSLSSVENSSPSEVSDRSQNALQDYARCFDQVRNLKRRLTSFGAVHICSLSS